MSVTDFTIDEAGDLAVAMCGTAVCQGDATSLSPSQLAGATSLQIATPRVAPGGDELFVRASAGLNTFALQTYTRAVGTGWDSEGTVTFGTPTNITATTTFSQPTRGGRGRHIMIADASMMTEYVQSSPNALPTDPWTAIVSSKYTASAFGVDAMTDPNLSPDGTILVFRGTAAGVDAIYYATRPSLDVSFGAATMLWSQANAGVTTPYMAPDCSRLFFSIDGNLDYAAP